MRNNDIRYALAIAAIILSIPGLFGPEIVFLFLWESRPLNESDVSFPLNPFIRLAAYAYLIAVLLYARGALRYALAVVPFVVLAALSVVLGFLDGGLAGAGMILIAGICIVLAMAFLAIILAATLPHRIVGTVVLAIAVCIGLAMQIPSVIASVRAIEKDAQWRHYKNTISDVSAEPGLPVGEAVRRCKEIDTERFNVPDSVVECVLIVAKKENDPETCALLDYERQRVDCRLDYYLGGTNDERIAACRTATTDKWRDSCLFTSIIKLEKTLTADEVQAVCNAMSSTTKGEYSETTRLEACLNIVERMRR